MQHGLLDATVERSELKSVLHRLLDAFERETGG
jgi:acetyl-CoA carboxylase beta subunit